MQRPPTFEERVATLETTIEALKGVIDELASRASSLERAIPARDTSRVVRDPLEDLSERAKKIINEIPTVEDMVKNKRYSHFMDRPNGFPIEHWAKLTRTLRRETHGPVNPRYAEEFERFLGYFLVNLDRRWEEGFSDCWPRWRRISTMDSYKYVHRGEATREEFPQFEFYADRFAYLMETKGYRVGFMRVNNGTSQNPEGAWEVFVVAYRYGEGPRAIHLELF